MGSLLDAVRRPEYTGDQRCMPCTVVNSAILLVACLAVALVSVPVAVAVGLVGAAAIALRGYLVPGTPTYAPRLVGWIPGDPFHADGGEVRPSDSISDADDSPDGDEVLTTLVTNGVMVADAGSLYLSDDFRQRWHDGMDELADYDTAELADAVRVSSPVAQSTDVVEQDGREYVVVEGEGGTLKSAWLTRPVAIAETAAIQALADVVDDPDLRAAAVEPLRMFLETCPDCGGDVVETSTRHCCGGSTDPMSKPEQVLACEDCNERLYTFPSEDEETA